MILEAMLTAALAVTPGHLAPGCQRAVIMNNSGNGPDWHVILCDRDDRILVVDGGMMGPGAVIIGAGDDG